MILVTPYNNPIAAPATDDADALLALYKTWSGNAYATLNELYAFMTVPGALRNSFLMSLTPTVTLVRSKYYTQVYG
jgi:hypothetical protein